MVSARVAARRRREVLHQLCPRGGEVGERRRKKKRHGDTSISEAAQQTTLSHKKIRIIYFRQLMETSPSRRRSYVVPDGTFPEQKNVTLMHGGLMTCSHYMFSSEICDPRNSPKSRRVVELV